MPKPLAWFLNFKVHRASFIAKLITTAVTGYLVKVEFLCDKATIFTAVVKKKHPVFFEFAIN